MRDVQPLEQPWGEILSKESRAPFESLVQVYQSLSESPDSGMQYAAAWALLYASRIDDPDAQEAFSIARSNFAEIAESPVVKIHDFTGDDTPLRASFAHAFAHQVRTAGRKHSLEERAAFFRSLEPVLSHLLEEARSDSGDAQGVLSEFVVGTLPWRPEPRTLSIFNTVPAGPTKDSRKAALGKFSTDLYVHHPTFVATSKGRANVQVKTTATPKNTKRYDQDAIIVVGLNEIVHPIDDTLEMTGREASFWLAEMLLKDMRGERLDLHEEEALLYTMADLYHRVVLLEDAKVERRIARAKHMSQKARKAAAA